MLDQPQIISFDRIKAVNHIVTVRMRGGIAQRAKRIKIGDGFFSDFRFHVLRLVHNNNWLCHLDEFNRLKACQPVIGFIDDVFILGEGINIDDQNLNVIVNSKASQIGDAPGIVNIEVDRHLVIKILEMIKGDFQVFQYALADGNGRNNNDEFFESILFIQFIDRSQINIGFPCACFHFHGKIHAVKLIRNGKAVGLLHCIDIFENLITIQRQPVANARFLKKRIGE